jgi:hypothetical protein
MPILISSRSFCSVAVVGEFRLAQELALPGRNLQDPLETENNMTQARARRYTDIASAKKPVAGSEANNTRNEDLGRIEDLILHTGVGPVSYGGVPLQLVEKAR